MGIKGYPDLVQKGFIFAQLPIGPMYKTRYDENSEQIPEEFTVNNIDERIKLYNEYNDNLYQDFIDEAKNIFDKYKTDCNKNNKYMKLQSDGGYTCGDDGKWSNNCSPFYCDEGYYFDPILENCISLDETAENIPINTINTYIINSQDDSSFIFMADSSKGKLTINIHSINCNLRINTDNLVNSMGNDTFSLTVNSDEKIDEKADTISVKEYVWVKNIKFSATGVDWTQVVVSWETVGNISRYQITYWTWKNDLNKSTVVSSSSILIENLEKDTTYYFQIIPQDENSHTSWDPSDVVEYRPSALACVVKWIKVVTEKIWDNYYLVRDPVENAISYEVYRSDWADMTDARLVWSLTGTRFQYLYNPDATKDEYAFYQVQAICPDWKSVVVDKAQKVKVWPVENILLIIIISIFVYSLYRLNKISDDN